MYNTTNRIKYIAVNSKFKSDVPPERIELSAVGLHFNSTRPTLYHWAKKDTFVRDWALIEIIGS